LGLAGEAPGAWGLLYMHRLIDRALLIGEL
jgi:hypothetical protein